MAAAENPSSPSSGVGGGGRELLTPHSGMSLQAPHPCQGRDCACRQARSQQAGAPPHPRPGQFLSVVLDSGPSQEDARQQTTLQGGPGLAPCPPLGHRAAWGWGAGSQEVQGQGCPAGVGAVWGPTSSRGPHLSPLPGAGCRVLATPGLCPPLVTWAERRVSLSSGDVSTRGPRAAR